MIALCNSRGVPLPPYLPPTLPAGVVQGVSTPMLASEVAACLPFGVRKVVTDVPVLDGPLSVDVADVLLRLGQALTPPVPTTAIARSFHWPMLKYLHFFDEVAGALHAGGEAAWYVHHGRTAVSDELGVAFSLLAGEWWLDSLGLQGFNVYDVEGCLTGRYGAHGPAVATRVGYRRRPDWIISSVDNSGARWYFVLESKGTKVGSWRQHAMTLASAIEQLEGITVLGRPFGGLAVRTVSGVGPIEVWSVDPPASDPVVLRTDNSVVKKYQADRLDAIKSRPKKQGPSRDAAVEDITHDELMGYAALTDASKLAQWSAEPELLEKLVKVPTQARTPRARLDLGSETALGLLIPIPGEPYVLFTGVLDRVEEPLRDLDFEGVDREQARVVPHSFKELRDRREIQVSVAGNGMVAAVLPRSDVGTSRLRSE